MFYPSITLCLSTLYLQAGFTALHLAAQNGHGQVLEVMRSSQSLRISSKKLGVTALHVAAYFGQAGMYILVARICSINVS
jgi:ankyrin repeat protein